MHSLDQMRRAAKILRKAYNAGDAAALARVAAVLPDASGLKHAAALHVLAREAGHPSWPALKLETEIAAMNREHRAERLKVALYAGHFRVVDRLLGADASLVDANFGLQVAALREADVSEALERNPAFASTRVAGPRTPILHLAFSKFWQRAGAERSIRVARMLVDHGADVNDSYPAEPGSPHGLSALYGALGHAGNLALAEWLLEHGADPNDNESLYHATELGHADGLRLLLKHGARPEGTNALPRAMDFDNLEMVEMLLEAGADPNEGITGHPGTDIPFVLVPGLHQAARRMCSGAIAEALIWAGADGTRRHSGHTAYAIARMRGNRPVAEVLERHGQATDLDPVEALLTEAAEGHVSGRVGADTLTPEARCLVHHQLGHPGTLDHVKRLIELGFDPNWTDEQGMPAIHVAAWEGHADAVAYLLDFDPDLRMKNLYGGDIMGTVIHGSEYCPARDSRDHLTCAALILEAGAVLHSHDIEACGNDAMADMLQDWADAHPERVVDDTK